MVRIFYLISYALIFVTRPVQIDHLSANIEFNFCSYNTNHYTTLCSKFRGYPTLFREVMSPLMNTSKSKT